MSSFKNFKLSLVFVFIFFIVYIPSFNVGYEFDDSHTILSNQFVHSLKYFLEPWTSAKTYSSTPENYGYRPVTINFSQIVWFLGNGNPVAFQIAKKLIYLFLAIIVTLFWVELFSFIKPLKHPQILFGLLLLHPFAIQVCNYIAASSSLLCGLFYFLSLLSYIRFRKTQTWIYLILIGVFYFLSVSSKEEGITLIAIVALIEIFFMPRNLKISFKALVALIAGGGLGLLLIISNFEPQSSIARGPITRWNYFATQWEGYFFYFGNYFFPFNFNFDNSNLPFVETVFNVRSMIFLSLNALLVFLSLWLCFRRNLLGLGILGFYIAVLPASSVVPLAESLNDHRAFISFLFFVIVLYGIFNRVSENTSAARLRTALVFFLFIYLSGANAYRNWDWRTSESLWRDTVERNPTGSRAQNNLAVILMAQGRYAEAMPLLTECARLSPRYALCQINLGVTYEALGEDQKAREHHLKGISLDPGVVTSRLAYSRFLIQRGYLAEAEKVLTEADQFTHGLNVKVKESLNQIKKLKGQ